MLPFIAWLNEHGSDVYLLTLTGHEGEGANMKTVTATHWQQDVLRGYGVALQAAQSMKLPLFFFGYSLGGLLGQSVIRLGKGIGSFTKQVLIAPAITIRARSYLLRGLFFLGPQYLLPSYTPPSYRVHAGLPLGIYRILFTEEKKWNAYPEKFPVPTLIIIDPKDELISYRKLKRITQRDNRDLVEIVELDPHLDHRAGRYHHLILDEATMGERNWIMATSAMRRFLFGN
jgi:alpha-beta hydrolase superfamily lysophospholipase